MPKNSIISTATYSPFTFEELLRMPLAATLAHLAQEKALLELALKSALWDLLIDPNDSARILLDSYNEELEDAVNLLQTKGTSNNFNKKAFLLSKSYAQKIIPIELAYKKRDTLLLNEIKGRELGLVYDGSVANTSVGDFIDNPTLNIPFADSKAGYDRVYKASLALNKVLNDYYAGVPIEDLETWIEERGFSSQMVNLVIDESRKAMQKGKLFNQDDLIAAILEQEMRTSGVSEWKDVASKLDYFDRIASAAWAAVGENLIHAYLSPKQEGLRGSRSPTSSEDDNIPTTFYRTVPNTTIVEDIDQINEDIAWLDSYINGELKWNMPDYLSDPSKNAAASVGLGTMTVFVKGRSPEDHLIELGKKYEADTNFSKRITEEGKIIQEGNFENLKEAMQVKKRKALARKLHYVIDNTDNKYVVKYLKENAAVFLANSNNKYSGFTKVKNNRGKLENSSANMKELSLYLNENAIVGFDPEKGFYLNGMDADGNTAQFRIDPEILTSQTVLTEEGKPVTENGRPINVYTAAINEIKRLMEEELYEEAGIWIAKMMNNLGSEFNSRAKIQKSTFSLKEENASEIAE